MDRPEDATLVAGASEALEALADAFALVAIVSGRSLEDLRKKVPTRKVLLAGAYGRERSDRPGRRGTEGWETVAVAASAALRRLKGVVIERKGAGIAIHFRAAPAFGDQVREVAETLAVDFDLDVKPGRMVFELVMPGPGKGEAILSLIAERDLSRALVAGDDWGDLEAFKAIRQAGHEAVIVAVASDEAPPELHEHADMVVGGPDELVAFLAALSRRAR